MTCFPARSAAIDIPAVVRKRRIDTDEVDRWIGENVLKAIVARLDAKGVANRVERRARSAANCVHVRRRMPLVDRYELYAEAKPDNGDVDGACDQPSFLPA